MLRVSKCLGGRAGLVICVGAERSTGVTDIQALCRLCSELFSPERSTHFLQGVIAFARWSVLNRYLICIVPFREKVSYIQNTKHAGHEYTLILYTPFFLSFFHLNCPSHCVEPLTLYISVCPLLCFLPDPEELCEDSSLWTGPSSGAESHDALQRRAQAAEDRARSSEEALTRAMDDLHKLKSDLSPFF